MNFAYSYLEDFFSLFFPELCAGCSKNLFKHEDVICTDCLFNLPYTNHHHDKDNLVAKQLYGRIPFVSASAYLYFAKGLRVQNLIHQLKYNKRPEVGTRIGELYGNKLKSVDLLANVDLILPVPLHPTRLRKRGYNQSSFFAEGLSKKLGCPTSDKILVRTSSTETQTHKSRYSRFENMKDVFAVNNSESINGKHILLVDDVFTTGATLEACALKLIEKANVQISIATIAFTQ